MRRGGEGERIEGDSTEINENLSSTRDLFHHLLQKSAILPHINTQTMLVARHISRRLVSSSLRRACATASSSSTHNFTTTTISNDIYHHKLPTTPSLSSRIRTFASDSSSSLKESYEYILVERRFPENNDDVAGGGVGIITLNRPKALNALCDALFEDLIHAAKAFDADDDIGCIVITGSGKAFAAGELFLLMYLVLYLLL